MGELPTAESIADAAKEARLSLIDMCERAGSAYTTYYRWRRGGVGPSISIVERWLDEIAKAARDKNT